MILFAERLSRGPTEASRRQDEEWTTFIAEAIENHVLPTAVIPDPAFALVSSLVFVEEPLFHPLEPFVVIVDRLEDLEDPNSHTHRLAVQQPARPVSVHRH